MDVVETVPIRVELLHRSRRRRLPCRVPAVCEEVEAVIDERQLEVLAADPAKVDELHVDGEYIREGELRSIEHLCPRVRSVHGTYRHSCSLVRHDRGVSGTARLAAVIVPQLGMDSLNEEDGVPCVERADVAFEEIVDRLRGDRGWGRGSRSCGRRATVGRDLQLLVATARRSTDGLLLGIAPMAIERRVEGRVLRYRALQFIGGHAAAADHLDLIVRTGHEDVARPLWAAITDVDKWDVFALDGLRPGSIVATLAGLNPGYGARQSDRTVCPVLSLPNSWEEYEARLGRKFRQNLRRSARNLEKESAEKVTLHTVTRCEDVDTTIQDLAMLRDDASVGGSSGSTFVHEIVEFHRQVASRFFERGMLRLYRLDIGSHVAAAEYCSSFGGIVSDYQGGYDRRWSRHGPGRLITSHAIRAAIEEGAHSFDFLRGDEAYKDDWRAEPAFDERIWMPASPLGRVVVPLRFVARKVARQLTTDAGGNGYMASVRRAQTRGLELLRTPEVD